MKQGGAFPRAGDSALAGLLLLHGSAMSGGLGHTLESLSKREVAAGIEGYRYFGLLDVAELLQKMAKASGEELENMDEQYGRLVPNDGFLLQAFEKTYQESPDAFSPLRDWPPCA